MSQRELDVVVFGATSVTGRRVAAYLAQRASEQEELRWAAAARDATKAERVLAEEGVTPPETIVADVGDPASLAAMAARASVVLNLVGPYTLHGEPVIEACVNAGSHYADLAGEIPFIRRMNAVFDARARAAGIKIVQLCGFEALPPDLGVALAARAAGDPEIACLVDPGCLVTDPAAAKAVRAHSPIRVRPRRRDGTVIAPMLPVAFINPAVIHRSAALRADERGEPLAPLVYREGIAIEGSAASLPVRYAVAGALCGVQGLIGMLARANRPGIGRTVSRFLARALPASGYGPTRDRVESWRWGMSIRATTSTGRELRVEIEADGHPGYLTTARMLGEAGVLLSQAGSTPDRAGCLTPSTALGTGSVERFARAGLRFSLPSSTPPGV